MFKLWDIYIGRDGRQFKCREYFKIWIVLQSYNFKLSKPASKHNAIDIIWTLNNTKEEIDLEELCFEEQTIFTVS